MNACHRLCALIREPAGWEMWYKGEFKGQIYMFEKETHAEINLLNSSKTGQTNT